MTSPVIYAVSEYGHRALYVKCLGSELHAEALVDKPSVITLLRLIRIHHPIIFATIEDSFFLFVSTAIVRSILRKKTLGLSLDANKFPGHSRSRQHIKKAIYKLVDRCAGVRRFSIIPSFANSDKTTNYKNWIYDPAFWDLSGLDLHKASQALLTDHGLLGETLDDEALTILYLGSIDQRKGFDNFVKLLEVSRNQGLHLRFIAAGHSGPNVSQASLDMFVSLGGILINRRLTEEEVLLLQKNADIFWGCYHPSFDQSSGIAGRAFQLNKTIIVRENSISERLLIALRAHIISSGHNSVSDLPYQIANAISSQHVKHPGPCTDSLRSFSVARLRASLRL